ncbi:MAG: hypothetical protein HC927_11160, partial [Deltaproteobacteria bacterium]|nr:hypothetical protein [Deltaproteobacteria bacterium]
MENDHLPVPEHRRRRGQLRVALPQLHRRPVEGARQGQLLRERHAGHRRELLRDRPLDRRVGEKYRGSLSGEHGDGRVRAEFIPLMIGEQNYALLRRIKQTWD